MPVTNDFDFVSEDRYAILVFGGIYFKIETGQLSSLSCGLTDITTPGDHHRVFSRPQLVEQQEVELEVWHQIRQVNKIIELVNKQDKLLIMLPDQTTFKTSKCFLQSFTPCEIKGINKVLLGKDWEKAHAKARLTIVILDQLEFNDTFRIVDEVRRQRPTPEEKKTKQKKRKMRPKGCST